MCKLLRQKYYMPILYMAFCFFFVTETHARDIGYGWSGKTHIAKIDSYWGFTLYELKNTANGCGTHSAKWKLPFPQRSDPLFEKNMARMADLHHAYMTRKSINIHCEASNITDFVEAE